MHPILRNVLVFIGALIIGGAVNSVIVSNGINMIDTPEGFDYNNLETYSLLSPMNLMLPFAAHALGTLTGAYLVAKFAASHWKQLAFGMGLLFLMLGAAAAVMIEAPMWFNALDLSLAYIPMGLLGWVLAGSKQ